ncbi:MAG TPA: hypothetical protein VFD45_02380 [Patescibacteria group bacterium]|nr:hypothetical protein [Patescibacteria group bacterium]
MSTSIALKYSLCAILQAKLVKFNFQLMQSILISSNKNQDALDYVKKLSLNEKIGEFDTLIIESEKQIGIKDIRILQEKTLLKPFKGKQKITILNAEKGITAEAQNALLKILEEPPANTIIALIIPSKELVLPTVLSRCKIIELNHKVSISIKEHEDYEKEFNKFIKFSQGEKLKLAESLAKDKEQALLYLQKIILGAREIMLKEKDLNSQKSIKLIQKRYIELKNSNANLRLGLESLFISI